VTALPREEYVERERARERKERGKRGKREEREREFIR